MSETEKYVMPKRGSYRSWLGVKTDVVRYTEQSALRKFSDSHTDPSYYQSTSEQVAQFMQAGKVLSDTRKLQYDFPDGKDTGADVPLTRVLTEPADISQALTDEVSRLKSEGKKRDADATAEKKRKELIDAVNHKDDTPTTNDAPVEGSSE